MLIGRNIISGLLAVTADHQFYVWTADAECPSSLNRAVIRRVTVGPVGKIPFENVVIPRTLQKIQADVLFSLGDTASIRPRVPHLLLVQQAYLAYAPQQLDFQIPWPLRMKLAVMQKYFEAGLRNVTMLVVQTEFMRARLAARWSIPDNRIRVVRSAVDDASPGVGQADLTMASSSPYVCYVADPLAHKNHELLPQMMRILIREEPRLRLKLTVGAEDLPSVTRDAKRLGVLQQFDFVGRLDRHRIFSLYKNAVALVMPSKLESFGLPLYEAMAVGCPIVVSDRPFAREACGQAALYADPDAAETFADYISKLLSDPAFRDERSRLVRERHREIHWTARDAGERYLAILKSLC